MSRRRMLQTEGTASAENLRQEHAQYVLGTRKDVHILVAV